MKKKFIKKLLFYIILLLITFCINHFVSADTFIPSSQKNDMIVHFEDGTSDLWLNSSLYSTLSYSNSTKNWYPSGLFYEIVIPNVDVNNTYTTSYTLRLTHDYAWGSIDDGNFSYYNLYKNLLNKKYSYGVFYNNNINNQSCSLLNYSSSTYYEQYDFTCVYSFKSTTSNQKLFIGIQGGGLGLIPFGSNLDIDLWNFSNTYVTDKTNVIIDQNTTIINQNDQTNQKLDNINNSLTNWSTLFIKVSR